VRCSDGRIFRYRIAMIAVVCCGVDGVVLFKGLLYGCMLYVVCLRCVYWVWVRDEEWKKVLFVKQIEDRRPQTADWSSTDRTW
jgi:hypothetical protein